MNLKHRLRQLPAVIVAALGIGGLSTSSLADSGQASSTVPVWSLVNGGAQVEGASSRLTRTHSGVSMLIRTHDLNAGHAYTLWMAVFNFPQFCMVPYACGDLDFDVPEVAGDVMRAGGNVVGGSGKGGFAGHKAIGDNSGSVFPPLFPAGVETPGLLNPMGAEIHLLMHSHGPKLAPYMPDMIQTFAGGCVDPGPPFEGVWFPEWGAQGPNTCVTEQVAVHPSPMAP